MSDVTHVDTEVVVEKNPHEVCLRTKKPVLRCVVSRFHRIQKLESEPTMTGP